jgi:predicted RNA-binding protein with PIN domain
VGSARWLVDGMNVVGARPDGWWRDRPGAMARLIEQLAAFSERSGEPVTVVFDGRPFPHRAEGIDVAFASGPGRNAADHEIAARAAADGDPGTLRVVTSDGELVARVRAAGVEAVSAGAFRRRLEHEG